MQGAEVLLRAEEHVGEFVDARVLEACAVQQGVEHRITVDSAGGADFTQFRQLEPQRFDDFIRLLRGQRAVVDIVLVVRQQGFVGAFRVDGVAAVIQLKRQLEQIKGLTRFFKAARRMGRNVVQNGGAVQQFRFAVSVSFRGGKRFRAVGQVLRQRQQGIAGVDGRAAAVDFVHAAAANGAAQRAGFLFQLMFDRQYAFLHYQLIVRGVEVAVQIKKLERGRAMRSAFVVENRPVRLACLVADDQFVGADAQRQLAHQFIEAARRFDGGGNPGDIAIKGAQRGGMFGAQGAFL